MQKVSGWSEAGGGTTITSGTSSSDYVQDSFPSSTVTVYNSGTTNLGVIFSDNNLTPKSNPFTAGTDGSWSFYAAVGAYDVQFSGTGITTPFSITVYVSPDATTTLVTPEDYGAIHDGTSHPLSTRFTTLAAAQAAYNSAYNFVTSLSQEIDYAAVKAASNVAFGADQVSGIYTTVDKTSTVNIIIDQTAAYGVNALAGKTLFLRYYNGFVVQITISSNTATTITLSVPLPFDFHCGPEVCLSVCGAPPQVYDCVQYTIGVAGEHGYTNRRLNKSLFIPGGDYRFGSNAWLVRNLVGARIYGAGRESTTLTANGVVFQTDGLWSSHIEGITFNKTGTAAGPIVDIDGNVPGHPYPTRSVQQNTFTDLKVSGVTPTTAGTYGVAQNRQGGASAQGENLWINPQISGVYTTFYNNGFNALANLIVRGDMQDYVEGVFSVAGWVNINGTSFESGHPYEQATLGGFDIHVGEAGVSERMQISGVRTESLQFYKGSSSQPSSLLGVVQQFGSGFSLWNALGVYTLHTVITKLVLVAGIGRIHAYYVSTAGTSGGIEPIWPASGTVADGSIVWTELPFLSVDTMTISGSAQPNTVEIKNCLWGGPVSIGGWAYSEQGGSGGTLSAATTFQPADWATSRFLTPLDATGGNFTVTLNKAPYGQVVMFPRIDASANVVTIAGGTATINGGASLSYTGGARGYLILIYDGDTHGWMILSKSF